MFNRSSAAGFCSHEKISNYTSPCSSESYGYGIGYLESRLTRKREPEYSEFYGRKKRCLNNLDFINSSIVRKIPLHDNHLDAMGQDVPTRDSVSTDSKQGLSVEMNIQSKNLTSSSDNIKCIPNNGHQVQHLTTQEDYTNNSKDDFYNDEFYEFIPSLENSPAEREKEKKSQKISISDEVNSTIQRSKFNSVESIDHSDAETPRYNNPSYFSTKEQNSNILKNNLCKEQHMSSIPISSQIHHNLGSTDVYSQENTPTSDVLPHAVFQQSRSTESTSDLEFSNPMNTDLQVSGYSSEELNAKSNVHWSTSTIDDLLNILEDAEQHKWEYMSQILILSQHKRIPKELCMKKYENMFGTNENLSILKSSLPYIAFRSGRDAIDSTRTFTEVTGLESILPLHKRSKYEICQDE
ncbi:hypothetical protein FF38_03550 [Lucilia cuprina]|uniref:Uncharacterized protein n=1 Tax=Lucilia cuprina TaxID=7375 RepID=A0A0L0C0X9_LUCCU|nr:hypothetical protein FF38_03550 [Lucilia cuprina]